MEDAQSFFRQTNKHLIPTIRAYHICFNDLPELFEINVVNQEVTPPLP